MMADVYTQEREREAREKREKKRCWGGSLFVRALFAFMWYHRLYDANMNRFSSVVRVTSWRSAFVYSPDGFTHIYFIFWWDKEFTT